MIIKDDEGNVGISAQVAIWLISIVFLSGVFFATLQARDYVQSQVKELRLELKEDLAKINSGVDRINDRLEAQRLHDVKGDSK